jgi:hypothetical protein
LSFSSRFSYIRSQLRILFGVEFVVTQENVTVGFYVAEFVAVVAFYTAFGAVLKNKGRYFGEMARLVAVVAYAAAALSETVVSEADVAVY